jgi:hypothetical protein
MEENKTPEFAPPIQGVPSQVKIAPSISLETRLDEVFQSLVRRLDTFDKLESKIGEIEMALFCQPIPDTFEAKLELYKEYTKIHLAYIDTLRKVVGQVDMENLVKTVGATALVMKLKNLPVENIKKLYAFLDSFETKDDPSKNG